MVSFPFVRVSGGSIVSGLGLGRVERSEHRLDRDSAAGDQLGAAAPQRGGERPRPDVLVDQDPCRAARLDDRARLVEIVLADQPDDAPSNTARSSSPSPSRSAIAHARDGCRRLAS